LDAAPGFPLSDQVEDRFRENDRKGTGMTEGKAPAGITLGSNTKITPKLFWGYFYSIFNFFKKGGMVLN